MDTYKNQVRQIMISGEVSGRFAAPQLALSGISKETLREAWQLADSRSSGSLVPVEALLLLKMISLSQNGERVSFQTLKGLRERPVPPPRFPPGSKLAVDAASTLPPALPQMYPMAGVVPPMLPTSARDPLPSSVHLQLATSSSRIPASPHTRA